MVRSNDPFWNDVEDMKDGSMKCKFCGHLFANYTSISRIKWHLSGERGHGVSICGQVPGEVQEAAFLAMHGGSKRHKILASSSNANDYAMSTSPQERNNKVDSLAGDHPGRIQALDIMGQAIEINWDELHNLLMEDDLENGTGEVAQPGAGSSSFRGLKYNTSETRGDPLPTSSTKLVGRAFEENTNMIWYWLMDDEVSTIGIYGMGGVGKTTMLQHIHNELLRRPDISHHVYWVTMSRDFNINKLQNNISRRIGLNLSNEEDELHRAVELSKELTKKKKWILILDDLWDSFELHKVGIPVSLKGCKLIITTRSEKICQRMGSQHKIKVKPLSKREAWTLFVEKLGHDITLSPEVERIAIDVARECAGLPLGIITIAGSLRGVDDLHEWRNTLKKLKESRLKDMEDEVYQLLRFSYDRLNDLALQQCLLYCALFPEDRVIKREELIGYLIDEGIMKAARSRQSAYDEGHTMLNKLENVCLLERFICHDGARAVKMHNLIRDMTIQIQQENSQGMVKAGAQIRELPAAEEWTENLTRVSLIENQIEEIPSSHSPRCPNLSTLLLCHNQGLRFIADSFFKHLLGLKVLDLSYTFIEKLPDSVSDLISLTALLLIGCENLKDVPSLKNLRALRRLDLCLTALEKMPQGMECLSNLRYLRLHACGEKEFPSGILPKLSHLQVFALEEEIPSAPITVKGKEVRCLRKLETLECHFEGCSDFVEYLKSRDETQSLSTYQIFVGQFEEYEIKSYYRGKTVWLGNLGINKDGDFQVIFPNDIQQLIIFYCDDVSSLINYAIDLEVMDNSYCNSMESLVSSSWFCSATLPSPSYKGIFSYLKKLHCYGCRRTKKLFPFVLLPNLVNLECIRVEECEEMEEIIATSSNEEGDMGEESSSSIEFKLPKLKILKLYELPELKSFCNAKLICNSLQQIGLVKCQKVKRMPIYLSLLENGQPSPPLSLKEIEIYPKEWWETGSQWWSGSNLKLRMSFVPL